MMTYCKLIVDARERAVIPYLPDAEVKTLIIGDYLVIGPNGLVISVVERKTLEDFAASLKDGRFDNHQKLLNLQRETGCNIIYLIEGPEYPTSTYGGIQYKNIESKIFHMMARDHISILRAPDAAASARLLERYVRSMDTLRGGLPLQVVEAAVEIVEGGGPNVAVPLPPMVLKAAVRPVADIVADMWIVVRGVTRANVSAYMETASLLQVLNGQIPAVCKSGRKVPKNTLATLQPPSRALIAEIISKCPLLTLKKAQRLVRDDVAFAALLAGQESSLAGVALDGPKRFGAALAGKLLACLNWRPALVVVDV